MIDCSVATTKFRVALVFFLTGMFFLVSESTALGQMKKVIVVVGAEGAAEYGPQFKQWSEKWRSALSVSQDVGSSDESLEKKHVTDASEFVMIGVEPPDAESDLARLENELAKIKSDKFDSVWLILIGHGTFDRAEAKFNLRGRDVTAKQLDQWLDPLSCNVVVINCASASGPFINQLAGKNRIVVTATKSGFQHNFARFGGYLADCIGDPTIDLDKDQQTSLLEAFLAASARTQEFYRQEKRLATELALLDDNGDGLGTPADWFNGVRAVEKPKQGAADGLAANQVFLLRRGIGPQLTPEQLQKRNAFELQLEQLRDRKSSLTEAAYFDLLEPILVELARIYHAN